MLAGVSHWWVLRHDEGCGNDWKGTGILLRAGGVMLAVDGAVEGKMWEDNGGNNGGKGKEGCEAEKGRGQIWS